jgi:hypothetical protein
MKNSGNRIFTSSNKKKRNRESDFSQVVTNHNRSQIGNVSVTASNNCYVCLYMKAHCRVYSYFVLGASSYYLCLCK